MIINLLACASALAATAQDAEQTTLRDSISGVWKGVATDAGPLLPEEGLPASLLIEKHDDLIQGQLLMQGFDLQAFEGHFDPKTRVLEFKARYQSIPLAVRLTVGDDELTGTVAGLGLSIDLAATRISHVVLEEPPAPSAPADVATLEKADWAEDLNFLAGYLPQVHADAFHSSAPPSGAPASRTSARGWTSSTASRSASPWHSWSRASEMHTRTSTGASCRTSLDTTRSSRAYPTCRSVP